MTLIAILIAAVVSVGISILFHEMDKGNNSIEKVRRYADKRQSDLEEYYKSIKQNFHLMKTEFDTRQTQANAAVKLLTQQNEEFAEKAKNLDSSLNSVRHIEAQISGYSKILNDLNEMTKQVEENLIRIQNESGVLEKIDNRISNQEEKLDFIEKNIPKITDNFSKHNGEQLKAIGQTLLTEYKNRADAIEQEVSLAQTKAEKLLTQIRLDVQAVYDDATRRAESLEDVAFEHLSKQAQARSDKYLSEMKEQFESLESKLNETAGCVEDKIGNRVAEIENKLIETENRLQEKFTADSESFENTVAEKFEQANQHVFESEEKLVANAKEKLDAATERFENHVKNLTESYSSKVTTLYDKYQKLLDSVSNKNEGIIAKITQKFDADYEKIEKEYQQNFSKANQKYADQIAVISGKNDTNFDAMAQKFQDDYAKIEAEYSAAFASLEKDSAEKIATIKSDFENTYNQTTANNTKLIEDYVMLTSEKITALRTDFENNFAATSENCTNLLNEMTADNSSKFDAIKAEFNQDFDELNAFKNRLGEILTSCNQTTDVLRKDVDGNTQALSSIQQELDTGLSAVKEKYLNLFNEAVASANQKEKAAFEQFNLEAEKNIAAYNQNIQERIAELQKSLTDSIQMYEAEARTSVEGAKASVEKLNMECTTIEKTASELRPQIDSLIKEVQSNVTNFQNETREKLENLTKLISDSVRSAVSEGESKSLGVLEGIDEQLSVYKKDIDYKLSQIQASGADVDALEKSVRMAMQEVQSKVLSDFDTFTEEQKRRSSEFEKGLKANADALDSQIKDIESVIDDLKATATGNMSLKLKEFEDNFNKELNSKNNEVDNTLADWKQSIESKLTGLSNTYEDSRRKLENDYLEELKKNIISLQVKSDDQFGTLSENISSEKNRLDEMISNVKDRISGFKDEITGKIVNIAQSAQSDLKNEAEKNTTVIKAQLEKIEAQLMSDLKTFEEGIQQRAETGSSTIDAALSEFNSWKKQLRTQLDESNKLFTDELNNFKQSSSTKITEINHKLDNDMAMYVENLKKQQSQLIETISSLQNKTEASIKSYEEKSTVVEANLKKLMADIVVKSNDVITEQNAMSAQSLAQMKQDIQTAEEQYRNNQNKFVLKMQNDANDMQLRMSEIAKELQAIRSNIQLYEKADSMKRDVEEKIANLQNTMAQLEKYQGSAVEMTKQFNALVKMNEDVTHQINSFDAQKTKVTLLEQDFNRLIALSNTIDARIKTLNASSDEIQAMEVTVRNYSDKLNEVSQGYERLAKKEDVIQRVLKDVDTSFNNLSLLEQRLQDCDRKTTSLPQEIKDAQNSVDKILQNGPKITEAVSRISNLDAILSETERKIAALQQTQNGLKKTELNLHELDRQINEKFEMLRQVTKDELKSNPNPRDNGMSPSVRDAIREFRRQGWSIAELAKRFKRTETEIELMLEMPAD